MLVSIRVHLKTALSKEILHKIW